MLIDPGQKASLSQAVRHDGEFNYISEYGYFDSVTACGISGFLERYEDACLVNINVDSRGQFVILVVEKY
jgi:hypothetical protein